MMRPLVRALSAILFATAAYAQQQSGDDDDTGFPPVEQVPTWISVPLAECRCSVPVDVNNCCVALATDCWRLDGNATITATGLIYYVRETFDCCNCAGCPTRPPDRDMDCSAALTITRTQYASGSIDNGITFGIDIIEAKLSASIGYQLGASESVSISCTLRAPPCKWVTGSSRLQVTEGKIAQIVHNWLKSGTWTTAGGCDPPCPIAGNSWNKSCGTGLSKATATLVAKAGCSTDAHGDCSDPIPVKPCVWDH